MPPKTKPNGFYMFMLAEQKKLKSLTNRAPSMREMSGLCMEPWKRLSEGERNRFETQAKKEKGRLQSTGDVQYGKLDCHRNLIADRKDPVKEEHKRRKQEKQALQNSWHDQDPLDILFHIIDFQVMYDERMENHFPLEIGMVSLTLNKGVLNFMHRFINPGEVPQGNRHLAISHSENTHKIPLNFEHGDTNLKALTTHMTEFLRSDSGKDIPPVFCLAVHRHLIENCLDFIYGQVFINELNKIQKVYCLEDLVTCLIANAATEEKSVPESQVTDMLCQNRWDYNSSIRCFYHEELDCSFCSLSIVRRYSFALFDILSILLQFELTDKHLPDETEQNYTVTESLGFGRQSYSSCMELWNNSNNWRNRSDNDRMRYPQAPKENAWQPPKVEPVKVPLSDDEDSENEREEPETTEFTYKKLRLPMSLAQVQSQVGQMSLQPGIPEKNAWGVPAAAAAPNPNPVPLVNPAPSAATTRPMGRGMAPSKLAQLRPMGRAQATPPPGFVAPPPGFGPRPGFAMGAPISQTPGAPGFPPLSSGPCEEHFPALSRGRGLSRGRAWYHNKN